MTLTRNLQARCNIETPVPQIAKPSEAGMKHRTIELDFARGMAVLLVMGYHFKTVATSFFWWRAIEDPLKAFGATGVDMFFVLSGFLVGGLLLHEYRKRGSVRVGRFLARRAFKIFPAYYGYLLFQIVSHHFPLHTYMPQNLLQLQNYTGTSISHTWTVSLEIHFYLLLALAMGWMASLRLRPRTLMIVFGAAALASFLSRAVTIYLGHPNAALFFTHNRLDSLLCGVLLATLACFFPARFEALSDRKWPFLIIGVLLAGYLYFIYPRTMVAPAPGWGYFGAAILYLGYAAVLIFLIRYTGSRGDWPVYKAVAWIGTYSYGIYLWHNSVRQPCATLAAHLPARVQWPALFVMQYASAIALGAIMTRLIEWPFLRYRERLIPQPDVRVVGNFTHPELEAPARPYASASGPSLEQELSPVGSGVSANVSSPANLSRRG